MDYETKILELAQNDERIVIMTAENRAPIRGIPAKLPERFFDTGITEQTMVGAATGLALRGRVPVVHALATFLTMRAYEFIRTDVGISGLPVKMVGFVPGLLSEANGPTHQALEDISILRTIPSLNIFCPADIDDMVKGMREVIESPTPWYVRYNPRPAPLEHAPFRAGEAEVVTRGTDVALLVYGTLFTEALEAARLLEQQGISTTLVNFRTLKPIDEKVLCEAVSSCRLSVTIEYHFLTGGLFTIVAETLLRNRLTADVLPIGMDNTWFKPALLPQVLEYEGLTGPRMAQRITERLG
jgi:transketolase